MKVVPYSGSRGQVKMRGRKTCVMSCFCCDARNFTEGLLWDAALEEIKDYERQSANTGRFGSGDQERDWEGNGEDR